MVSYASSDFVLTHKVDNTLASEKPSMYVSGLASCISLLEFVHFQSGHLDIFE